LPIIRMPNHLFILRHGQKEQGHETSNQQLALSHFGERQCESLGKYLRERILSLNYMTQPIKVNRFCSTLNRSIITEALAFKEIKDIVTPDPPIVDSRLNEKSNGIFDELTQQEILKYYPIEAALRKRLGYYDHRPIGGDNGPDMELRVLSFIADPIFWTSGIVVIYGHGTWIRIFQKLVHGLSVEEFMQLKCEDQAFPNCGVIEYEREAKGRELPEIVVPWSGIITD